MLKSTLSAFLLLQAIGVDAFWRMQCGSPLLTDRVDPLVQPGVSPARHVHNIMGGNAFDKTVSWESLQTSSCTSCEVKGDKSIYWIPTLYFKRDSDGLIEQVSQKDGMLVYYIPERGGKSVELFPKGFAMLAGDPKMRTFDENQAKDTEKYRRQLGVGFNCLNYAKAGEAFAQRREMPSKDEMKDCVNGLRADIIFPSCWNGELDSDDHRSHVAYPSDVEDGTCPESHPRRLITMKFETLFDVDQFRDTPGRFVWSTGDLTGYGYHGDFINGWNPDLLQAAYNDPTCVPPVTLASGGEIRSCKTFVDGNQLQDFYAMNDCTTPSITNQKYAGPSNQLAGCSPVGSDSSAFTCEEEPAEKKVVTSAANVAPPSPTSHELPSTMERFYQSSKSKSRSRSRRPSVPKPSSSSIPEVRPTTTTCIESMKPTITANPAIVANHPQKGVKEVVVTVVETITQTIYDEAVATVAAYVPHFRHHRRRNW